MKGFLLIDKDKGDTSFNVIRKLRRVCVVRKMGHAGTLDPLATGLLVVGIGEGTKLLEYFIGLDKEYEVEAVFGAVSDSFDADGNIENVDFKGEVCLKSVERLIGERFFGEIDQVPPKFSALKIAGEKAYELARQGKEVNLKARKVRIQSFDVEEFNWPIIKFRVKCGSGTYVRSLIHDLGQALGCGAYVKNLRRTVVGNFLVQGAVSLAGMGNKIERFLLPLEAVIANFDILNLNTDDMAGLSDGKLLLGKKIDHSLAMGIHDEKLVGVVESVDGGIKFSKIIH